MDVILTSLSHAALALAIMVLCGLPLRRLGVAGAWWIGAALAIGFYWGREKAQFERALADRLGLDGVVPLWHRGWFPFEWGLDGMLDLAVPLVACLALARRLSR